ncbi:MAG: PH domain-containing protein [Chloroflexi bacterium]|nr:PH domain-containing protein [Chloroflexota bacterium]
MFTITFRLKMDWWLPTLIFGVLGITAVMTLLDPEGGFWAFLVIIVLGLLSFWILFGSRYLVEESKLRIVFGPLRLTYPLEKLVLVRKGGLWAQVSSFREPRLRLAFSRDNIIIETRPTGWMRRVVISPRDRQEFLRVLKERAPQVRVEGF